MMRCQNCSLENPDGAKFCIECASPLERRCPQCGSASPPTAKFCSQCATPLGGATIGQPAKAAAPDPSRIRVALDNPAPPNAEGERKIVTALFADIKGSTELMEDLDPEEARAIIDPALKLMIEAVQRYDGYIVQSTGDGVFALFGAPAAYEDHPQRALYSALRLQEEMRRYSSKLREAGNLPIEARVGVNTGEVVVRTISTGGAKTEYTPIGHTANLASRMQALAPTGSIAISEQVRRLVEGYFAFKPLGPTKVKGLSEPVNVYEVTGLGPLRTRLQRSAGRGLTKFVGREREMETMPAAADRASSGHGQIVAAIAEAGTGKSRLFFEFKPKTKPGWMVLETFSISHGKASAYLPLLDLLQGYFKIANEDDQRTWRAKVTGNVLALDRSLEDTLPYLFALLGIVEGEDPLAQMDGQVKKRRTLEAIKRILLRESLNQPLMVIFEDLHWIDEQTQEFLNLLADSIGTAKILLLVNYRPRYSHQWGSKTYYTQLRLDPLGNESAEEMLSTLLGNGVDVAPLKRVIIEKTEGSPFFMEETVQVLFDEGVLVRNGTIKLAKPLAQLKIPPTVQAILAARIDRLPTEAKELLQTLAVIGREFPLSLIRAVVSKSDEELDRLLNDLQLGEFIYERPAVGDIEFMFKHALTQEVAYNSVLIERRKNLHERTGQALESIFTDQVDGHLGELAYHYSHSDNSTKGIEYLRMAAQQNVLRSANRDAVTQFGAALRIVERLPRTEDLDRQELNILTGLGPALMSLKGFGAPECEEVYTRARNLCLKIGETPALYAVLWGQWRSSSAQAKWDDALVLDEELLSLATGTSDPLLLLEAHHASWKTFVYRGQLERAGNHVRDGLALYDPADHQRLVSHFGGHDPGVCGYSHGSINLWLLGSPDQSLDMMREALGLARRLGHDHSMVRSEDGAAWLYQLRRDSHAVERHAQAAIAICRKSGFAFWEAHAQMLLGWALGAQGRLEDGIALLDQGLAEYRKTGATEHCSYFLVLLAECLASAGRTDDAFDRVAEATGLLTNGERFHEAELNRITAELLMRRNGSKHDVAEAKLREAIRVSREQRAKSLELHATTSLARLLTKQNRRDEARVMLAQIYSWFTEGFDTADLKQAKALIDELDTTRGD